MKRFHWDLILALLLGLGAGLAYSWVLSPLRLTDSEPSILRADFKDQYREVIAASYAATGNLTRAQARLMLLKDPNPIDALNSQAQRTTANGQFVQADHLAALAIAIKNGGNSVQAIIPTEAAGAESLTTAPSPVDFEFIVTETPLAFEASIAETPSIINTLAPRPTRTAIPTPGAPFQLIEQDTVCDINLQDGLLQVIVYNPNRRQLAGVKIVILWDSGNEEFFTGLKPELGNGYADFSMSPGVAYTIQLGPGSDIAADLIAPTCQTQDGETFIGGYKLTFQQP